VLDLGLADLVGAEMPSSRLRVCWAFWGQSISLGLSLAALIGVIPISTGLTTWMLAVVGTMMWWWSTIRDHQKDDLKVLAENMQLLRKALHLAEGLQGRVNAVGAGEQQAVASANVQLDDLITQLKRLLKEMQEREIRHKGRFFSGGLTVSL
jgi:hypothetical protein